MDSTTFEVFGAFREVHLRSLPLPAWHLWCERHRRQYRELVGAGRDRQPSAMNRQPRDLFLTHREFTGRPWDCVWSAPLRNAHAIEGERPFLQPIFLFAGTRVGS